jgi:rod shape-determining protein MreD
MLWAWYAAITAVTLTAAYLFTLSFSHYPPNLFGVLWQLLATSLLYPFAHRLIDRFDDADVRFR